MLAGMSDPPFREPIPFTMLWFNVALSEAFTRIEWEYAEIEARKAVET
jgi:hypothetical protein